MSDICVGLCTCPNEQVAREIATKLVEMELAACVNIIPQVRSIYRWQDKIQIDTEAQLVVKTGRKNAAEVYQVVQTLHSYEVPEWIVLDVAEGGQRYLDWVKSSIK